MEDSKTLKKDIKQAMKVLKKLGDYIDEDVMQDAEKILIKMVTENQDQTEDRKFHTLGNIYPVAAVYMAQMKKSDTKEEAYKITEHAFYTMKVYKGRDSMKKMMKIPGMHSVFPKFAMNLMEKKYGAKAGFKMEILEREGGDYKFDVLECPYFNECKRYGVEELTDMFCTSDDICYSDISPRVVFKREGTIGRGDDKCDFYFHVKKKGEE